jgi:hypothetical protein
MPTVDCSSHRPQVSLLLPGAVQRQDEPALLLRHPPGWPGIVQRQHRRQLRKLTAQNPIPVFP